MANKISAVIIVKDEAEILEKCLKSIQGIDEIIILDTGSTDKTPAISLLYTDKVFVNEYKWNDNFAEARNFAKTKATGDWILSIDADEELEKRGIKKIRKAIAKAKGNSIDVIMEGKSSNFFFPRIFKNKPEIFWKGVVHNYLNIAEENRSDIHIKYYDSPTHKKDPDRTFRILKEEVCKNPELTRETFYLAREYIYKKSWPTAIYWLERYVEKNTWPPEKAQAYLMLSKAYFNMRQVDKAKDACLQAIKINSNNKDALKLMADLSGPGNKKRWLKFEKTATNEGVLFKRN